MTPLPLSKSESQIKLPRHDTGKWAERQPHQFRDNPAAHASSQASGPTSKDYSRYPENGRTR